MRGARSGGATAGLPVPLEVANPVFDRAQAHGKKFGRRVTGMTPHPVPLKDTLTYSLLDLRVQQLRAQLAGRLPDLSQGRVNVWTVNNLAAFMRRIHSIFQGMQFADGCLAVHTGRVAEYRQDLALALTADPEVLLFVAAK